MSSLVAVVPSLEFWRMLHRSPSSTGICASCLTVTLQVVQLFLMSGKADLNVNNAGGWIYGCKSGALFEHFLETIRSCSPQHFSLEVVSGEVG